MAKLPAHLATKLTHIPNVGKATVADLQLLGIEQPQQLVGQNPFAMYKELCRLSGTTHDPCVIDVFIAIVRYMEGGPDLPWWHYTAERKLHYK